MTAPKTASREEARGESSTAAPSAHSPLRIDFAAGSSLRLVGTPLGLVLDRLLDGETCPFDPAPEPTLRELIDFHATTENVSPDDVQLAELTPPPAEVWAEYLGLRADYEAPESGDWPVKGRLQTLIFPQGLASRLAGFLQDFERAAREADGEELFLSFGALEKGEGEERETAPLLLLGVRLLRSPEGPLVESLGAAPFLNPEIEELLGEEAAAKLAAPHDGATLAALIHSLEGSAQGWRPRRYLTLFAQSLLPVWAARDQAAQSWKGQSETAPAKSIASGGGGEFVAGRKLPSPREIDEGLEPLLPLDDAQARVLLAALEGESLLVQGAPKSGKTRAAAALALEAAARGKRVLYLSARAQSLDEMKAAVKETGLGQETLFLEGQAKAETDLPGRLAALLSCERQAVEPEGLEELRQAQKERRDALREYREAAATPLGKMNLTVAQTLYEAGRLKLASPNLLAALPKTKGFDPLKVDEAQRRAAKEKLLAVEAMVARVSAKQPLAQHPWAGVSALGLGKAARREAAVAALEEAKGAFAKVVKQAERLGQELGGTLDQDEQLLLDIKSLAQEGDGVETARPRVDTALDLTRRIFDKLYLKTSNEAAAALSIETMIALAEEAPEALGLVPRSLVTDPYLDEQLAEIDPLLSSLLEAKTIIAATFRLEGVRALGSERLREMAEQLRGRKFLRLKNKEQRLAAKQLRKIRILKDRSATAVMPDLLEETARFLEREADFFSEPSNSDLLGEDLESAEYWMAALRASRDWVRKVELTFDEGFGRRTQIAPALLTLEFAELTELVELRQDPAFADLQWLRDRLLASGQDWDFAKGPAWQAYLSTLVSPPAAKVLAGLKPAECGAFVARCGEVAQEIAAFEEAWKLFQTRTELRASLWEPRAKPSLKERLKRMEHALSDAESLAEWIALMVLLNEDPRPGVTEIMKVLVLGTLPKASACDLYDLLLFAGLAEAALAAHPILARFAPGELDALRVEFAEGERQLAELRSQQIAASRAEAVAAAKEGLKSLEARLTDADALTAGSLLREELDNILTLAPCLATTPALAARWLPAKQGLFDLVILDDATLVGEKDLLSFARRAAALVAFADPMRPHANPGASGAGRLAELFEPQCLESYHGQLEPSFVSAVSRSGARAALTALPLPRGSQEGRAGVIFHGTSDLDLLAKSVLKQASTVGVTSFGVVTVGRDLREALEERIALLLEDKPELRGGFAGPAGRDEGFFLRTLADYRGEERDLLFFLLGHDIEPLADLPETAVAGLPFSARQELRVFNGVEADLLAEGPDESAAVYLSRLLAATKQAPETSAGAPGDPLLRALGGKSHAAAAGPLPDSLLLAPALWVAHDREASAEASSLRESLAFLPERLAALGWSFTTLWSCDWRADPEGERERLRKAAAEAASRVAPLHEKQA